MRRDGQVGTEGGGREGDREGGKGAKKRDGLFIGLWETDPPQGQLAKYKTEVALSVYGLDGERRLSPPFPVPFGHIDHALRRARSSEKCHG